MNTPHLSADGRRAFTLTELLIVISIIVILAAFLFPAMTGIKRNQMKKVAKGERTRIENEIERYKLKNGHYPPDNPTSYALNPLYYELSGTVITNGTHYVTVDGSTRIAAADLPATFGVSGFANSSTSIAGTDERPAPGSFLQDLKPGQIVTLTAPPGGKILVCTVGWPASHPQQWVATAPRGTSPWQYNSSHPTNNPDSYDLWVDLIIDDRTNRISNWSEQPQIVW